jgi:hypothetical protein
MSSYRQQQRAMPLEEAIVKALAEIALLDASIQQLAQNIADQFPESYTRIAKWNECVVAHNILSRAWAHASSAHGMFRNEIDEEHRKLMVFAVVGVQTRIGREYSQRVRLGNVVSWIKASANVLRTWAEEHPDYAHTVSVAIDGLDFISETLDDTVTFPITYG